MKVWDIAFKDLRYSFRSAFALAFMFGVPLLTTLIFVLAFGGLGGDEGFALPQTQVQVANLDAGSLDIDWDSVALPEGVELEGFASTDSMGGMIVQFLQVEDLADLLVVTEAPTAAAARAAVDAQAAGVAIIIPENFTAAVTDPAARAEIEFYQDPTLTIGPSIVKSVVRQLIDGFSSTKIALAVVDAQLAAAGVDLTAAQQEALVRQSIDFSDSSREFQDIIAVEAPPGAESATSTDLMMQMVQPIFIGMMILYAFFTGTTSAQAILDEEHEGTLPRLFTTPTPVATVLSGKYLAIGITILVQVIVLLLFSRLAFGFHWGALPGVILAGLSVVLPATTFGIFVMSWLKDLRQVGIVYGGVVTFTGMLGIMRIFTASMPTPPALLGTLSLLVPQGWSMRAWSLLQEGADMGALWLNLGALVLWSGIFFIVGRARFQRRFA